MEANCIREPKLLKTPHSPENSNVLDPNICDRRRCLTQRPKFI